MERPLEQLFSPSQPVVVRLLGRDCEPFPATVLQVSKAVLNCEIDLAVENALLPVKLETETAVRIDAPDSAVNNPLDTMMLGEIVAWRAGDGSEAILTVAIRHVLRHLTELSRMRRALFEEAEPRAFDRRTNSQTDRQHMARQT